MSADSTIRAGVADYPSRPGDQLSGSGEPCVGRSTLGDVRRRIAFLAAALVAGLGVAVYRNRKLEQGEARLRDDEVRNDGDRSQPSVMPKSPSSS